jgi:hypothetical protein
LQEFRRQAELVEGLRGGVLRVRVRDFNDRFGFSLYERKKERVRARVSDLKYKIISNELRASSSIDIRGVACPAPSLRILREEKWSPIGISHGRNSRAVKNNNNNSREREGVKEENPATIPIVFLF